MASPREGPNPLRPYHVPPSSIPTLNATTTGSTPRGGNASKAGKSASIPRANVGSSARDMLSDLDYGDYLGEVSPSVTEVLKGLMDQGIWKYTSVLMAQPFEVAKTVLQVQDASTVAPEKDKQLHRSRDSNRSMRDAYDIASDDSDTDSQSYFTSATPLSQSQSQSTRRSRRRFSSPSPSPSPSRHPQGSSSSSIHTHTLASASSLTAVISAVWAQEGAWGVWKGSNSTFIHSILSSTISSFLRSLICAILALPDPATLPTISNALPSPSSLPSIDLISSPAPLLSLLAIVSASGLAGLILAPLDIARTKLMLTPSTHPPRSILPAIRSLGSWIVPGSIFSATFLHSTLPSFITASTPLFLRSRLRLDPVLTPTTYAIATFGSQVFELGVRLPIETVLRRGQLAVAKSASPPSTPRPVRNGRTESSSLQTVVQVGPYKGLMGTMYHIIFEEGTRGASSKDSLARVTGTAMIVRPQLTNDRKRKGQGLEGLWRGWRVGVWGLVGVWGAGLIGGGAGKAGEF